MMKNCFLATLLLSFFFLNASAQKNAIIQIEEKNLTDEIKNASISIVYPLILKAPNPEIKKALEQKMQYYLSGSTENKDAKSPQTVVKEFINMAKANPPAEGMEWYEEISLVIQEKGDIVSLTYQIGGFTGGAHEFHSTQYSNFDLKTGKEITLKEVLKPGTEEEFLKIAEKQFRKDNKIKEDESFDDKGYFMEKFQLSQNYLFEKDYIYFYYNEYEIAPYVMGTSEFYLYYSDFKNLIRPDGFLKDKK